MKNRRESGIAAENDKNSATGKPGDLNRAGGSPCPGGSLFQHRLGGDTNCVSGFAPNGRQLFQHRLTGGHELPQACSPLTGGGFSLNLSGECAVCGRRERAAPRGGARG